MQPNHVVLWLGHRETHIIAFAGDTSEAPVIVHATQQPDHHVGNTGTTNAAEPREYYEKIIDKIREIPQWLVAGPADAKLFFTRHLHRRHAHLGAKLIGLETVDQPSDGQLLGFARKYFASPGLSVDAMASA